MGYPNIPCAVSHDLSRHERDTDYAAERESAIEHEAEDELQSGQCRPALPDNIAEAVGAMLDYPKSELVFKALSDAYITGGNEGLGKALMHEITNFCRVQAYAIAESRIAERESRHH